MKGPIMDCGELPKWLRTLDRPGIRRACGCSRWLPSDPTGARRAQFLGSADWVPRRTGGKAGESAERGGFGRIENLHAVAVSARICIAMPVSSMSRRRRSPIS
jgi:hypothetical protein